MFSLEQTRHSSDFTGAMASMEVDEKVSESKDDEKTSIQKKTTTVEYPELDLTKYASNYRSNVKVDRLLHIARVCPTKKAECYRLAVAEVRKGIDVGIYDRVMEEGQKVLGATECQFDAQWMTTQSQTNDKQIRYGVLRLFNLNMFHGML